MTCAACGAAPVRDLANYCLDCGKTLDEDYQPLDSLRSSYRLQGRRYLLENAEGPEAVDLFAVNRNAIAEMLARMDSTMTSSVLNTMEPETIRQSIHIQGRPGTVYRAGARCGRRSTSPPPLGRRTSGRAGRRCSW